MYDKESGASESFILEILKKSGFHVIFLPENGYPQEPYTSELNQMGIEVQNPIDGWFSES